MTKVSQKYLNKNIKHIIFKQFWESIASINNPTTISQVFSDLLTQTEAIMLAKRFTIAVLLVRGKTTTEIHKTLNVTNTTICSVSGWLRNAKPATRNLLLHISKHKNWENLGDQFEKYIDRLPPKYGRDWSKSGKEKYRRSLLRDAKKALR